MIRRRFEPHTFDSKLAAEKSRLEERAAQLSHGPERDALFKKISQLDTAAHLSDWLTSPGLQPPK